MGTKAVFAVASNDDGYFTNIIGMTCDGVPENLKAIAKRAQQVATKLRCKTAFLKRDRAAVSRVLAALEAEDPDWLFQDNVKNAQWVSYSAIFDPKTGSVTVYDGMFDYQLEVRRI